MWIKIKILSSNISLFLFDRSGHLFASQVSERFKFKLSGILVFANSIINIYSVTWLKILSYPFFVNKGVEFSK